MFSKLKKFVGIGVRKPVITSRQNHAISRRLIDDDALKVLYRLNQANHTAYLVGGGVRDLLLGRKPKDFDVSTSAHPRQIKLLFRNCFLIGRRFRLAHIRFGDKIIETSTFRRQPPHSAASDDEEQITARKSSNTFGTPEEDARMRDFTINGLFYDIRTFTVIDHVGGQKDLERGIIRCIGDPRVRFPEDPVRMVRAVRFASRLNFTIEKKTYRAILTYHQEIADAAPARLIEELYRLFGFGTGQAAFRLLHETKLLRVILPAVDDYVTRPQPGSLCLWDCLAAFDRMELDSSVPRETAILCALMYPLFDARVRQMEARRQPVFHQQLAREVLEESMNSLPVPRRIIDRLVRAFDAQRRFHPHNKRFSKKRFVLQQTFPDALLLREIVLRVRSESLDSLAVWRTLKQDFLSQNPDTEKAPPTAETGQPDQPATKRRRRRRRRKPRPAAADGKTA